MILLLLLLSFLLLLLLLLTLVLARRRRSGRHSFSRHLDTISIAGHAGAGSNAGGGGALATLLVKVINERRVVDGHAAALDQLAAELLRRLEEGVRKGLRAQDGRARVLQVHVILEADLLRLVPVLHVDVDEHLEARIPRLVHLVRRLFDGWGKEVEKDY